MSILDHLLDRSLWFINIYIWFIFEIHWGRVDYDNADSLANCILERGLVDWLSAEQPAILYRVAHWKFELCIISFNPVQNPWKLDKSFFFILFQLHVIEKVLNHLCINVDFMCRWCAKDEAEVPWRNRLSYTFGRLSWTIIGVVFTTAWGFFRSLLTGSGIRFITYGGYPLFYWVEVWFVVDSCQFRFTFSRALTDCLFTFLHYFCWLLWFLRLLIHFFPPRWRNTGLWHCRYPFWSMVYLQRADIYS